MTKYVNYGHGCHNCSIYQLGRGTGFIAIPSFSNPTLATGLRFFAAKDSPELDPISVTLEGSNATILEELHKGSSWTLIYNGSTGINFTKGFNRVTDIHTQWFSTNKIRYASYRLLITEQAGNGSSVQYGEAMIRGYI